MTIPLYTAAVELKNGAFHPLVIERGEHLSIHHEGGHGFENLSTAMNRASLFRAAKFGPPTPEEWAGAVAALVDTVRQAGNVMAISHSDAFTYLKELAGRGK